VYIATPFTPSDRDCDVVFKSTAQELLTPQGQGNFDWSLSDKRLLGHMALTVEIKTGSRRIMDVRDTKKLRKNGLAILSRRGDSINIDHHRIGGGP
jgi:hypothetical protein